MIHLLNSGSDLLAAFTAAIAAYYWYRAAQVEAPASLQGLAAMGGPVMVNTKPLIEFAHESGRRNKAAALCSAAAAFFAFISWAVSAYVSYVLPHS